MNTAFLLTGGNLGNRSQNLELAQKQIRQTCGQVVSASPVYKTAAWGFSEQPEFYNQALEVQTFLSPDALMLALLSIEERMGRKRTVKLGPRTIDIDILLMNDMVYDSSILTVPHPHLHERRFALTPLADIAANVIHPFFKKTINELLHECTDTLAVYKISGAE
jgi:2-amino-4-hydroxy-6-hydroxymethyldihydropteridine diphosphokinase